MQFEQRWLAAQPSAAATLGDALRRSGARLPAICRNSGSVARYPLNPKMRDNLLPDD